MVTLLAIASLLIVVGLMSAMSAPGAPPTSNKADAYGSPTPTPTKPTNPKTRAACDKYYSATNEFSDARECRAIAAKNVALKKCSKKSGAAKAKCVKAAKKKFAAAKAAIARQRKAEKACQTKWSADNAALDPSADDYPAKAQVVDEEYNECLKRSRSA
jgi:hypothetical protein